MDPPIETKSETKTGADPDGKPWVQIRTAPCATVPRPSVTIRGWILSQADNAPLATPMIRAHPLTIAHTSAKLIPSPVNCAATTLAKPMTKGIDRSIPPMMTTNVCPTDATARRAASTSMARIENGLL